ncbi:hypothetical protein KUTeg_008464 [Tegillarca granosa]|uniref:BEN domain-containing protein n=1 Tax=Tegillarca granosa TaxID=220873 RepID=A0ABQ9FE16_TEGGR|nr:hypothetical protein KUTeg_008464 [Tegillarca granosa]
MELQEDTFFAIMHWEDKFTSIIKLSDIKHPRKPLKCYFEGEYVTALFQKKPYKARISEISDDRSKLQAKKNKNNEYPLKFCYTSDSDDDGKSKSMIKVTAEQRQPKVVSETISSSAADQPIVVGETRSSSATDQPIVVGEARSSSAADQPIVAVEARSSSATDQPIVVVEARSSSIGEARSFSSTDQLKVVGEARSSSSRKLEKRVADLEKYTKDLKKKMRALENDCANRSLNTSTEEDHSEDPDKPLNNLLVSVSHLSCNNEKDINMIIQRLSLKVFSQAELVTCSRTGKKTSKSGEVPKPALDVGKMILLEKAVLSKCQNLTTETFRKKFDNILKMERRKAVAMNDQQK